MISPDTNDSCQLPPDGEPGSPPLVGWVVVVLFSVGFHLLTFLHLDGYYATHLPHYDSMGSYIAMFEIAQSSRQSGLAAGLELAINHNQSWLYGLYAALFAEWLPNTPAGMQGIHSLCVFAAIAAIFVAARTRRLSVTRACAATLVVFVPDVLYEFQGGLADLQRDVPYLMLATAAFFSWFALLWRPGWWRAVWFGALCGLVPLSRGTALPFFLPIIGPVVAWGLWHAWQEHRLKALAARLCASALVFAVVAGPFVVWRLVPELGRYTNPYAAYQVGDSVGAALAAHWTKPVELLVGQLRHANSLQEGGRLVSLWAALGAAGLLLLLRACGVVRKTAVPVWRDSANRMVAISGAWALLATMVMLCGVVRLRDLGFPNNKHPFYAVLIAVYALAFVVVQLPVAGPRFRRDGRHGAGLALAALLTLAVLITGFARSRVKILPSDPAEITTARNLALKLKRPDNAPPTVAYLWFEGLSVDSLQFYSSMGGGGRLRKVVYEFGGYAQDFAVSAPDGTDLPAMMAAAEKAIVERADFIVVNTSPTAYRNPNDRVVLFRAGGDMVDRLRANPQFAHAFSFTFRGESFDVLQHP